MAYCLSTSLEASAFVRGQILSVALCICSCASLFFFVFVGTLIVGQQQSINVEEFRSGISECPAGLNPVKSFHDTVRKLVRFYNLKTIVKGLFGRLYLVEICI